MKKMYGSLFFLASALFADSINEQLDALQQLRTLMPERVWFQEFSIRVERDGFEKQAEAMKHHRRREETLQSRSSIAQSRDYFLMSTMSGENVQILDLYQQFEQSPFWRTPEMMDRLDWLENE